MKIQFFNIREKGKLEVDDFKITLQLKKKNKIRISFIHASFKCLQKKSSKRNEKALLEARDTELVTAARGRRGEGSRSRRLDYTRRERERERGRSQSGIMSSSSTAV